jgi:hypothetical protein
MKENKLIAEFMEVHEIMHDGYSEYDFDDNTLDVVAENELKYHTSWDWLMPVVEKIETISGKLPTHIGNIPNDEDWESNNFLSTNIEETYKAVVEFIKTKK